MRGSQPSFLMSLAACMAATVGAGSALPPPTCRACLREMEENQLRRAAIEKSLIKVRDAKSATIKSNHRVKDHQIQLVHDLEDMAMRRPLRRHRERACRRCQRRDCSSRGDASR